MKMLCTKTLTSILAGTAAMTGIWGAWPAAAAPPPRPALELESYLSQVRTGNGAVKAALETSAGALQRSREGSLMLAPAFFANIAAATSKPASGTSMQGESNYGNNFTAGVSQLTTFGLQAKFSYQLAYTSITGASPLFVQDPQVYDAKPTLELSQSLWRNSFGKETRGTQQLLRSQALATSHAERFKAKAALAEAEISFWRLVAARQAVTHQKESVERANKMRDWAARRAELQLSDQSDLLQADSALQARKLELALALDEELAASRAFNTLRGVSSDDVPEALPALDSIDYEKLPKPERKGAREDLLAAEQAQTAAIASTEVAMERNSPTFDVFASMTLNGRDPALTESASRSMSFRNPSFTAGLKFAVPLDFGTLNDTHAGFAAEHAAAETLLERKRFEQDREWADLTNRYEEARRRLDIAAQLEKLQKEKFLYEKDRHARGRSTMFQALMFEQEYAASQLAHLRAQTEVLRILAQLKTFAPSTGDES